MATYTLTGNDSIILNNIPLVDFANGDIATLEIPDDLIATETGKNGNTIFALNESGKNATLTVRPLISSDTDKRLNGLIPQTENFASTILLDGSVVKQVGDGQGNVSYNTYLLSGGMVKKIPGTKSSVNGDTQQAVMEYVIFFANTARSIM